MAADELTRINVATGYYLVLLHSIWVLQVYITYQLLIMIVHTSVLLNLVPLTWQAAHNFAHDAGQITETATGLFAGRRAAVEGSNGSHDK